MKKILFFFSLILLSICTFSQEEVKLKNGKTIIVNSDGTWKFKQGNFASNTFSDPRDGHVYKTITIGTQRWIAENLAYKANDGCWAYNNDQSNVATYGYLYDWETAIKVCPTGWHLPSDAEWSILTTYLDGDSIAGGKLKTTSASWREPNTGATNSSGFSAIPHGFRTGYGAFVNLGYSDSWWSSTEYKTVYAWPRDVTFGTAKVIRNIDEKTVGKSVRCIKDN